ncbi:putative membrane protein [Salinihabitans flavidus]|uniref:Protoporphyrinogen IX oxidase n=1 Tax=Salinihabitans flavidus TaxID=569882 RepID=A0A1H8LYY7_9RHOB|nr:CopD family protein [Salinihabitans flavidus]SEO10301.1 putative membrane protein [Salinihabitans flavidus]
MTDLLAILYPWTKSLHIMAVLSWMAGLFYLPRLFVYHAERAQAGDQLDDTLKVMEYRLLRYIMGPASIATWIAGLMLVFTPGIVDWSAIWPYTKGAGVIAMTGFHHWLMIHRKKFERNENNMSGRNLRMMNEVPTLLMIVIVISVVVRF